MGKLTLRDLQYIKPAVIWGWQVEQWINKRGNLSWYWEGDPLMPVKVSKTMEKLVSLGLMEYLSIGIPVYRRTQKALSLECKKCHGHGEHYDDDGQVTCKCSTCNGLGLTLGGKGASDE